MFKKIYSLIMAIILICFWGLTGCIESTSAEVSESPLLLRIDRVASFFGSSLQQHFSISLSDFSRSGIGSITYPTITALESNVDSVNSEVADRINNAIRLFFDTYTKDFVDGTSFQLDCQIVRFDERWLSIKYQGEVWTPSRVLGDAFALNFDMGTGEIVAFENMFNKEAVLIALGNGEFIQVYDVVGNFHTPEHLERGYRESRVLYFDENRNYDFYFDNDSLYLIINAYTTKHYTIYEINLNLIDS